MKYFIPGKTFLLGEYAALDGGPAILFATKPYFVFELTERDPSVIPNYFCHPLFHPDSPAGRLLKLYHGCFEVDITVQNPYGSGGFGASSAAFLAISSYLRHPEGRLLPRRISCQVALDIYAAVTRKNSPSVLPSGADVLAQSLGQCAIVFPKNNIYDSCAWPFDNLSVYLAKTKTKVATHTQLAKLTASDLANFKDLQNLTLRGMDAIKNNAPLQFINIVRAYQTLLEQKNLMHTETAQLVQDLQKIPGVLAAKGCGAMGADVIAIYVDNTREIRLPADINIIATEKDLACMKEEN